MPLSAMLMPLLLAAMPGEEPPPPECAVTFATRFYHRLADMPEEIRADLASHGPIADAGEPFEETDFITDASLPGRRFVLGGVSDGKWFVWVDHGGFVRHDDVFGYRPVYSKADEPPRLLRFAALQGEPCVAINAFLAGVQTPLGRPH